MQRSRTTRIDEKRFDAALRNANAEPWKKIIPDFEAIAFDSVILEKRAIGDALTRHGQIHVQPTPERRPLDCPD
jgi:hypothetical protein